MSHRAGLAALDADLTKADVLAWDPVIRAIEAQCPSHPTYAGHLYHALTYGWLVGEVIRQVGGVMPGQDVREAIADRLGLHSWIGLPGGYGDARARELTLALDRAVGT